MKERDKEKYNDNLAEYSSIVRERTKDRERILGCLKMFEYFEDYEKCKDLINILKKLDEEKNGINQI
jgi:hypothetical protein